MVSERRLNHWCHQVGLPLFKQSSSFGTCTTSKTVYKDTTCGFRNVVFLNLDVKSPKKETVSVTQVFFFTIAQQLQGAKASSFFSTSIQTDRSKKPGTTEEVMEGPAS